MRVCRVGVAARSARSQRRRRRRLERRLRLRRVQAGGLLKDNFRGFRVALDVKLGHGVRVAAARGPAHHHNLLDPVRHVGKHGQQQRHIRKSPRRHQVDLVFLKHDLFVHEDDAVARHRGEVVWRETTLRSSGCCCCCCAAATAAATAAQRLMVRVQVKTSITVDFRAKRSRRFKWVFHQRTFLAHRDFNLGERRDVQRVQRVRRALGHRLVAAHCGNSDQLALRGVGGEQNWEKTREWRARESQKQWPREWMMTE